MRTRLVRLRTRDLDYVSPRRWAKYLIAALWTTAAVGAANIAGALVLRSRLDDAADITLTDAWSSNLFGADITAGALVLTLGGLWYRRLRANLGAFGIAIVVDPDAVNWHPVRDVIRASTIGDRDAPRAPAGPIRTAMSLVVIGLFALTAAFDNVTFTPEERRRQTLVHQIDRVRSALIGSVGAHAVVITGCVLATVVVRRLTDLQDRRAERRDIVLEGIPYESADEAGAPTRVYLPRVDLPLRWPAAISRTSAAVVIGCATAYALTSLVFVAGPSEAARGLASMSLATGVLTSLVGLLAYLVWRMRLTNNYEWLFAGSRSAVRLATIWRGAPYEENLPARPAFATAVWTKGTALGLFMASLWMSDAMAIDPDPYPPLGIGVAQAGLLIGVAASATLIASCVMSMQIVAAVTRHQESFTPDKEDHRS